MSKSYGDTISDCSNLAAAPARLGGFRHLEKEPMREIHEHETNDANKQIKIVADEQDPDNGNASHVYEVSVELLSVTDITFQHGPVDAYGINGITNEVLLVIVADRLRCFQTSKYACEENAEALLGVTAALHWLEARTSNRTRRNVEGTNKV